MEFHSYCSYDGSPVGFVYGVTDISPTETEKAEIPMTKKGTNAFLRHCFESGLVRRVYGTIPGSKNKVLLLKGFKAFGVDGIRRYMNFALVYGEDEKHLIPKPGIPSNTNLLSQELAKALIITHNNEFGYQLNASSLRTFLFEKLKSADYTDFSTHRLFENDVCYIGTSHDTKVENLSSDLGMDVSDFSRECSILNETFFQSPAKKSLASSYLKIVMLLAMLLVSITLIALWILKKQ